jgi:hypothetical protein
MPLQISHVMNRTLPLGKENGIRWVVISADFRWQYLWESAIRVPTRFSRDSRAGVLKVGVKDLATGFSDVSNPVQNSCVHRRFSMLPDQADPAQTGHRLETPPQF